MTVFSPLLFDPFDSIVFLTNRVGRLLAVHIQQQMSEEESWLISTHVGVLVDLWSRDGVRQQDLAVSTIKDKATITRSLHALAKHNLVTRVPDADDRRNKRIYLTAAGRQLQHKLMPCAHAVTDKARAGIDEAELAVCKDVLRRMYENLL